MPGYVRVVRGTFDPARLEQATSVAASIHQDLMERLSEYESLEALKDQDGRFLWLAHFREQSPLVAADIEQLWQRFQEQAKAADVTFDIEEFGVYEVTYTGRAAPSGPGD
jgi:hypothetical protein